MRAATSLFLGLLFVVPVLTQDAPAATHLAFVGARLIDGTGAAPVAGRGDGRAGRQDHGGRDGGERQDSRRRDPGECVRQDDHAGDDQRARACRRRARAQGQPGVLHARTRQASAGVFARYGVTTVFSLGGDGPAGVQVRDEKPAGIARLFVAGPVIAASDPDGREGGGRRRQGDEGRHREDPRRRQPGRGKEDARGGLPRGRSIRRTSRA